MSFGFSIKENERVYLRELAKKYSEYANLPIMEERKRLWYSHNFLSGIKPVIVMETGGFAHDFLPELKCETIHGKEIESNLIIDITNYDLIGDDKVISPYYTIIWKIDYREFDIEIEQKHAEDSKGRDLGYSNEHPIKDLEKDLPLLKPSTYKVDREYTLAWKTFVEEIIGDILPVKIKNRSLAWYITPSRKVVKLMGLENMMYSIIDYPDEMHALYKFINNDILKYVKWQEKEGLLTLNNENDYTGAGSYGFTTELPSTDYREGGSVASKDLWVNMNSQETVGISADMFKEFTFPYYYDLAKEFGLVYFGCCEPVHSIWDSCISKLPGIRKVSVSPWSDEEYMGNALRDSNVIYSRKPSPNFLGVDVDLDENAFSKHIVKTLEAAKGCQLEFIFRDVYTLSGNTGKPGKAVKITRELIEKMW